MLAIANGKGSEIIFTLIRQPEMSDEKFAEDAKWVEKGSIKKRLINKTKTRLLIL